MSATIESIETTLNEIRDLAQQLLQRVIISGQQVHVTEGVSEISERLGIMTAGEFRTGINEPNYGFSGVRMRYPSMTYDGQEWNLVGVNNDVLEFGLSASTGKAYAGAGTVVLDSNGITLEAGAGESGVYSIHFVDTSHVEMGFLSPYLLTDNIGIQLILFNPSDSAKQNILAEYYDVPVAGERRSRINLTSGHDEDHYSNINMYGGTGAGQTSHIDIYADTFNLRADNMYRQIGANDYLASMLHHLDTPLTSTSWDGDAHSTTAKTLIDLSAVFGAPAGVKAVLVGVVIRDSDSAATDTWLCLSPNNTASSGILFSPYPVNDRIARLNAVVPCNVDGDIYFQISASGVNTMDIDLKIWGYYL